jgi:glycosyltransferase involved in cell wall biosynthesis
MPVSRISVIAPMLNEADHIEQMVADIAAQDFDGEIEVFVADGGSTDDSVALLHQASERLGVQVTLLANPRRWVSNGLNTCIRHARGSLIVRLDCHSRYPSDYFRRLAEAAEETGALNVGGVVVPVGRTRIERAVASAMDSAFGGIGWTRRAAERDRSEVDTVTFGAFRPEAFERAGLFDESLVRNQDDEFNHRLRRSGGSIVLDPTIELTYTPRGSYSAVARQYYQYGFWKVPVMRKHRQVLSARSLAPAAFVLSLVALLAGAPASRAARRLVAAELSTYGIAAAMAATWSLGQRKEPRSLLASTMAVFPALHLSYGLGMLHGLLRAVSGRPWSS